MGVATLPFRPENGGDEALKEKLIQVGVARVGECGISDTVEKLVDRYLESERAGKWYFRVLVEAMWDMEKIAPELAAEIERRICI